MKYQDLVGKYLNGYKIVKIEDDPFIKGQVNLWTDEWKVESFGDRSIIKFFIRDDPNIAKIYQELVDKETYNLKQTLRELDKYINSEEFFNISCEPKINDKGETHYDLIKREISKRIDKILGEEKC